MCAQYNFEDLEDEDFDKDFEYDDDGKEDKF